MNADETGVDCGGTCGACGKLMSSKGRSNLFYYHNLLVIFKSFLINLKLFDLDAGCTFVAVPFSECPSDPNLSECTFNMATDALCEADQPLPDGTTNYNIDNCYGYDVFRCTRGERK